ncbi:hypothetical protein RI103_30050 [Paraburkholderia sp. FT54]|uniref:hypothetical protein n=1 Tax=Paraburkholderia sp. FT54 TaxID=3074437 RepID=UPI0028772FC5|nr:hypothetical protein [Paraburkholderia sp. FT54]WNC92505.1 hypothetical protein RI103_30050 [Paraburkholderia sp. FT54]
MTSESSESGLQVLSAHASGRHRLVVRAALHGMRIAAIWQVLLPFSRNVEKVDVTTLPGSGFEEVTIALAQAQRELVDAMVARFRSMSWVTSATLC